MKSVLANFVLQKFLSEKSLFQGHRHWSRWKKITVSDKYIIWMKGRFNF